MFELFSGPLGWLMKLIYNFVSEYFIALVVFTVLVRLVLFPLSIKNQKNQMDRARVAPKLERIQKKYGQDRQKVMQKQQELYEKEGVKLTGGCLPMILQMLVLFSVIGVIYKPLTYIQQIPEQDLTACYETVDPNYGKEEGANPDFAGYYAELNLFKEIDGDEALQDKMNEYEADRMLLGQEFSKSSDEIDERAVADLRARIEELSAEISKHPLYIAFSEAQLAMNSLMADVNAEIKFCITGERPAECTHDCSTCKGCH